MSQYGIYTTKTFLGKGTSFLWYTEACSVEPFAKRTSEVELKYILQGPLTYILQGKKEVVQSDVYTVINQDQYYEGYVTKHLIATKGLYFFLDPALLSEVHDALSCTSEFLLSDPARAAVREFDFVQGLHSGKATAFGAWMKCLGHQISIGDPVCEEEMFYQVAQRFLESQWNMQSSIASIKAEKKSTRLELYRRLCVAKEIMLDGEVYEWNIADIAREAALSEFHFIRCFKQAFGISPYQFLIDQRLIKAKEMLESSGVSVSEVATSFGFSELGLFSRAFKARFGVSPRQFRYAVRGAA